MTEVSQQSCDRVRRFGWVLALALGAAVMLAPPATGDCSGSCHWDGNWQTHNQFGSPKLILTEEGRDVSGRYTDDGGEVKGKISGELSSHKRVWEGRFHQTVGGTDRGKFSVTLQGDDVSYKGTFHSQSCPDQCNWTGEHS
jgi:hypothetical protein